jgi:transposase
MDFIGFDLGKVSSQVCIITEDGELIERRIKTDREHIAELLGTRLPARLLIEASTESEWVARYLEELGLEGRCCINSHGGGTSAKFDA